VEKERKVWMDLPFYLGTSRVRLEKGAKGNEWLMIRRGRQRGHDNLKFV
jgi:hypothetical protein